MTLNIIILLITGGILVMDKINERKKMIEVKISRDDIRAINMMAGEFLDNSSVDEDIELAERIRTSCRLWLRRGEPRDRKMRKLFPIKKKEYQRWGW